MSEGEQIRQLIANDLAHEAEGDVLAAVKAGQRRGGKAGAIIAVIVAALAIVALVALYVLAAQVLPPMQGEAAFLWAPVAMIAALIIVASGIAASAALSVRR